MYPKIIAVCDGTALATAMFADDIKPGGCRIQVYEAGPDKGMLATATATAVYDEPRHFPAALLQIDVVRHDVGIEGRDDGMFLLTRQTERGQYEYVADPRQGFNIVMYRDRVKGDDGIVYESIKTGEWERQKGIWFLRKLTEENREDGAVGGRSVFAFDEFEVNPIVSDDEFKWEQLSLCAGGIVVDQRPNPPSRGYRNVPSPREDEKRLDTLVERVKSLPPTSAPPVRFSRSSRGVWILVFTVAAGACAVAAYLLRGHGQKGRQT